MSDPDPQIAEIERHVAQLEEHFDSVQIICTGHRDGKTTSTCSGSGNWYARIGSVREWLTTQDEHAKEIERMRTRGDDD